MSKFFFFVFIVFVLTACPAGKKDEPAKTPDQGGSTVLIPQKDDDEKPADLEELVYDAVGYSVLKIESNARSQAELKGRKELIRVLAEDARKLIAQFILEQPDWFSSKVNTEDYGKAIETSMIASTTLKGSRVSEYSRNGDTTFAVMELPLMSGYEVIENAIVSIGMEKKYIKEGKTNDFRKVFKEFFLKEKKKLLTPPA